MMITGSFCRLCFSGLFSKQKDLYMCLALLSNMVKKYTVIIEKDEDGWLVSEVVELPGCHTQAKSMDQLLERTKEAIRTYLETEEDTNISETFVGVQQIEV